MAQPPGRDVRLFYEALEALARTPGAEGVLRCCAFELAVLLHEYQRHTINGRWCRVWEFAMPAEMRREIE